MAEVFSDDFNRADSTTIGGNWTQDAGAMEIKSNTLRAQPAPFGVGLENLGHNTSSIGSADYEVEAVLAVAGGFGTGVTGRISNPSNDYYLLELEHGSSGTLVLYKRVGGTYTLLGSYVFGSGAGTYTIKLSMQGTTIKGYLDGVERISVTDSAHSTEGDFGYRCFETDDPPNDSFDSYKVYTFTATGNPWYAYAQQ